MDAMTIFKDDRSKILDYLRNGDNGSYSNLKSLLIQFEKMDLFPEHYIFNLTLRDDKRGYGFYEFPTNELCSSLASIFKYLNIKKLNEVAAGSGLLTARLRDFTDVQISPSDSKLFCTSCNLKTFIEVHKINFRKINNSHTILISWLHADCENEFIEMINKNKPLHILHLGDTAGGCCYSDDFLTEMKKSGYNHFIVPLKMISKADYFTYDKIRPKQGDSSRTALTLLSKEDINIKELFEILGDRICHHLQLTPAYCLQDINEYYKSQNKIRQTFSN